MEFTRYTADFGRGLAAWYEAGSEGEEISFLAANGFPVSSYRFMLPEFGSDYRITALENRGVWPGQPHPGGRFGWYGHADDLIAFLDYRRETGKSTPPVLAVGHSIGGTVSLLAAVKRPDLFKGLVLVDPATVPGRVLPALGRIRPLLMQRSGLVRSTKNRRPVWESPEAFAEYHGGKSVFRRFRPEALADYASAGLVSAKEGEFRLRYSRDWEAWNFQHTPGIWRALKQVTVPVILLRAEFSNLHPEREFRQRVKSLGANVTAKVLDGVGHMAFQENPKQTAEAIRDALSTLLGQPQ